MSTLPYANPTNTSQWAKDFLTSLGAPSTASNVGYVEAWQAQESPSGYGYNPLGSTENPPFGGAVNVNSSGVKAYQSWAQGLAAVDQMITSQSRNTPLLEALRSGIAGFATLSTAQAQGSWASANEKNISAPGTSTPFTYGGSQGLVKGAPGVAGGGPGVLGQVGHVLNPVGTNFLGSGTAANTAKSAVSGLTSGIFGPLVSWLEKGAADVTFVGFGLMLVIVGLVVTFKGGSQIDVQSSPSPTGGVAETGGAVKDAAVTAAA